MKGSSLQWSFSNMGSPLVSFKSAQEQQHHHHHQQQQQQQQQQLQQRGVHHRSYPPHFPQRTLLDKQGGSQYPITSHQWHQNDLHSINHLSDGRSFPGAGQTSHKMYSRGNASSLLTSTMRGASSGSGLTASPANGPVVGSTDLRSSPSISTGPCQLTIFYNGSVCVYDNVSPEKAQAIMLLAGNGESSKPNASVPIPLSSTSKAHPPPMSKPSSTDPVTMKQPPVSRLSIDPATMSQPPVSRLSTIDHAIMSQPPVSRLSTSDTPNPNQSPVIKIPANDTSTTVQASVTRLSAKDTYISSQDLRVSSSISPITRSPARASTSGNEVNLAQPVVTPVQAKFPDPSKPDTSVGASGVKSTPSAVPQARKASLARFLEKRKERVIGASPYPVSKNSFECDSIGFGPTSAANSTKQLDVDART